MSTEITPWFTTEANGTPFRAGVYETIALAFLAPATASPAWLSPLG